MTAIPRQKACIACADSKRRCDKQLPECQRCLDRDVDCIYPQSRKRRRTDDTARARRLEDMGVPTFDTYDAATTNNMNFEGWPTTLAPNMDLSFADVMPPFPLISSPSGANLPDQDLVLIHEDVSGESLPWFMLDDTWDLHHSEGKAACATYVELEPLIHSVEKLLESWVKDGCNSFIHRRLYKMGMPSYLQDAFTTLATYVGRTPATKDLALQIAEDRLSKIVTQRPSTTGPGAQGIRTHLARVQALFVYQFILLFDGSVRSRASGERQLPVLRQWVAQMREAAREYRGGNGSLGQTSLQWALTEFDREYSTSSELWNQWILTESIRRTQVVVDTISNTYETMILGSAECTGAVMFTARRGLWEAESAIQWFDLSCAKPPLLVPSMQPSSLMSQCDAEEIDEFVKLFWTFLVGTDKMQCWIDKSKQKNKI